MGESGQWGDRIDGRASGAVRCVPEARGLRYNRLPLLRSFPHRAFTHISSLSALLDVRSLLLLLLLLLLFSSFFPLSAWTNLPLT